MRSVKILVTFLGTLALPAAAIAQTPLGSYGEVTLQGSNPAGKLTRGRVFGKTADGLPYWVKPDGTVVSISAGGGGAGTVTSVACGSGVTCTPSPIVGAGSIAVDPAITTTLTGAQTLTNKILTQPVINGVTSTSGNVDFSGTAGSFKTSTGTNTLGGDVVISGSHTLSSGTGTSTFNGTLSFAANIGVTTVGGTGAFDFSGGSGLFRTTTGAVTLGPGVVSITGALGANLSIGSGFDFTFVGGASDIDASASSGVWKSPTGQFSANGHIVLSTGKNISGVSGTSGTLSLPWTAEYANQWISPSTASAGSFLGNISDGGAAVAWDVNTANTLTATAKIWRVRNNAVELANFGVAKFSLADTYSLYGTYQNAGTTTVHPIIDLENTTPAIMGGLQQSSPAYKMGGQYFDGEGSASNATIWTMHAKAVENVGSDLTFVHVGSSSAPYTLQFHSSNSSNGHYWTSTSADIGIRDSTGAGLQATSGQLVSTATVANGAGAVAHIFNNTVDLATNGATLASFRWTNTEKLAVRSLFGAAEFYSPVGAIYLATSLRDSSDGGTALGASGGRWSNVYSVMLQTGDTPGNKPACTDATNRGGLYVVQAAGGASDILQACMKSAADAYAWRTVFSAP